MGSTSHNSNVCSWFNVSTNDMLMICDKWLDASDRWKINDSCCLDGWKYLISPNILCMVWMRWTMFSCETVYHLLMTERIEESHMRIPRSWRYFKLLSQSMRYFWIGLNFLLDEKCFVPSRAMNWIHVLSYFYYSNLNRMTQPNVREMKQAAS